VRLLGTVVSSDPSHSIAMVEKGGGQLVLRTGGELDGAEVVEIRSESVLLRRNGAVETLRLASVSLPSPARGGVFPASPAAEDADSDSSSRASVTPAQRVTRPTAFNKRRAASGPASSQGSRSSQSAPSEAEVARSNDEMLADLAAQARFAPVMDNDGKLRGVALMNIASDSTLERLGLRSDDVVIKIQGVPIDSSGRAMSVARSLDRTNPVKLDIERHGLPIVVVVDPRSL
jgi:type II secretion system protein C